MESSAPFALHYTQRPVHGYDYNVCLSCKNSQQTVTNKFMIKQDSKCLPSYNTLDIIDVIPDPEDVNKTKNTFLYELSFDGDNNYTDIGFNETHSTNLTWNHYFTNSDLTNCNFDKCELLAEGCQYPYTQTDYLTIGGAQPWTITAATNVTYGYNTTFCMKCSNAWDSIQQDQIVVTQTQQIPWLIVGIVIAVVAAGLVGCISYCLGKKSGVSAASALEMADGQDTGRGMASGSDTARSGK